MHLQIITPKGMKYDGEVERFQFTSATGMMEFLPGHAPLIAEVKEGIIVTDMDEMDCGNGVVKVEDDEIVVVCE
ncbi:MAG: hypothetical protein IJP82_00700 [Bacteroidaceae bacterium]|nr:hypothetical protein [Bacteroidaceae bacterium]